MGKCKGECEDVVHGRKSKIAEEVYGSVGLGKGGRMGKTRRRWRSMWKHEGLEGKNLLESCSNY